MRTESLEVIANQTTRFRADDDESLLFLFQRFVRGDGWVFKLMLIFFFLLTENV